MADQWYYSGNGQRRGPVSDEELKQVAASGQLKPTDKVWKKGMAGWQAASEIEGLIPVANEPPPVPHEPAESAGPPPLDDAADPLSFLNSSKPATNAPQVPPPSPSASSPQSLPSATGKAESSAKQPPFKRIGIAMIVAVALPFLVSLAALHDEVHGGFFALMSLLQNGAALAAAIVTLRRMNYSIATAGSLLTCLAWVWLSYFLPLMLLFMLSLVCASIGVWAFSVLRRPEARQCF